MLAYAGDVSNGLAAVGRALGYHIQTDAQLLCAKVDEMSKAFDIKQVQEQNLASDATSLTSASATLELETTQGV